MPKLLTKYFLLFLLKIFLKFPIAENRELFKKFFNILISQYLIYAPISILHTLHSFYSGADKRTIPINGVFCEKSTMHIDRMCRLLHKDEYQVWRDL